MPLLQREAPTLGARIYDLLKELIQELVLYWMKFKAWLTPGDADDKVQGLQARQWACASCV